VETREEILESLAPVTQRQLRERCTAQLEHIEDNEDRGSLQRYLTRSASCDRQALLQGSKVCIARLVGDDDFSVQQRPGRQRAGRLYQFGKGRREIAKVSTEYLYVAICPMTEQASEAVQLRLIQPLVTDRQAVLERGQHRRKRERQHGCRRVPIAGEPSPCSRVPDWRNALRPNCGRRI